LEVQSISREISKGLSDLIIYNTLRRAAELSSNAKVSWPQTTARPLMMVLTLCDVAYKKMV
jgi:hypothetical protein